MLLSLVRFELTLFNLLQQTSIRIVVTRSSSLPAAGTARVKGHPREYDQQTPCLSVSLTESLHTSVNTDAFYPGIPLIVVVNRTVSHGDSVTTRDTKLRKLFF